LNLRNHCLAEYFFFVKGMNETYFFFLKKSVFAQLLFILNSDKSLELKEISYLILSGY